MELYCNLRLDSKGGKRCTIVGIEKRVRQYSRTVVGYQPCFIGILTRSVTSLRGQSQAGSLIRRSPERVTEAPKRTLSATETARRVQRQKELLDCETDRSSRTKVGLSDQVVEWCSRSTDKSYPGDNRLISPKSPYRRGGLASRCRLITSWGCDNDASGNPQRVAGRLDRTSPTDAAARQQTQTDNIASSNSQLVKNAPTGAYK